MWKGKGKVEPVQDFEDLNPVITYRHFLSNNLGVRDPLRVIALCDSDAFYAACEMNRLEVDKDVPLVVLQWDSLIAVNYPARKYGISRMDKKKDALKRCPHLKVVHVATYKEGEKEPGYWDDVDTNTHKVSLDYYRRESMKIAVMFKEELPGCEVEKASIDEAFIDFSKPVRQIMLQRYPYLAQVPLNAPQGVDTPLPPAPLISWQGLGNLVPVNPPSMMGDNKLTESRDNKGSNASGGEEVALKFEAGHVEDVPTTWHDIALSIGAQLMGKAREEIRVKLGYSTSAGIARNKFLAKLTASCKKPNNQSILRNAAIPHYLKPMQFQKIRFLGGKLGDAFAKEYDASTVGDLLSVSLEEMQSKFGENSVWIYEILRGIDRFEVKDKGSTLNKSMLASKNLPKPITKASEGQHWIRVLAAELALRLKEAREVSPNLWPKTIVLHARRGQEFRSKQTPFPFIREVTVDTIASAGNKLWKEMVGNTTTLKISSVQLAFTGIDVTEAGQRSIDGFLKPASGSKKRPRDQEQDQETQEGVVVVGSSFSNKEQFVNNTSQASPLSYACSRCGKSFHIHTTVDLSDMPRPIYDQRIDDLLTKAKLEHDDFHFAQDLSSQIAPRSVITVTDRITTITKASKERKVPSEPRGIEKFFRK